jgi:hypothetical protein
MSQKSGKRDALRKEEALLHTFVAGQKYGVGRDATRRFFVSEKVQGQQIVQPVALTIMQPTFLCLTCLDGCCRNS